MESHGWTMRGPLNTNNIRAQDGTLAATIADSTGNVVFQNDVEVSQDLDVDRDATIFRNLEVQGPLATFIQSISVGVNAAIGQDLTVGQDVDITRDLAVGRNADVVSNLTVGTRIETVNLRMTGNSPATGRVLTAVDANGNVTWGTGGYEGVASVPSGRSILFYTNDTVLGYTILDVADDDLVYVTKGTIHGSEAGGVAKPGGSWTQDHFHGFSWSGYHTHKIYEIISRNGYSWAPDGATLRNWSASADSYNGICTEADDDEFATNEQWAKRTQIFITGNTHAPTGNTWRPKGRNFTLQQRN